jgi:hypothetical protein
VVERPRLQADCCPCGVEGEHRGVCVTTPQSNSVWPKALWKKPPPSLFLTVSLWAPPSRSDGLAFSSPHTPHVGRTHGDFYRPLAPGQFTITTTAAGYRTDTQSIHVPPGAPP